MNEKNDYPLVLVFYLDGDMMRNPEIIGPFADSINKMFIHKDINALAFFIPTKGEERVECINPVVVPEVDMANIYKIIDDIKESFSIGIDIDVPDVEIDLNDNAKPCDCGNNPNGDCEC